MLSDNQKAKLKKAILEGKVSDKTTLQIFNMVSDLEEKVESLTNDLKQEVEKSIAEVKASEVSLDKVLESVKGKDGADAVVDYPKLIQEVVALIPPPKDGISPIVDYKKIIDEVVSKIPVPKDGVSPVIDYAYIISQIPIPENGMNGKDGSPDTPIQIADKLNTLEEVVDQKVIKGLTKKITDLSSNIAHNAAKLYTGISETRALELIDQNTTTAVRTKRVVTATDATSITPNADTSDITHQTNTQATGTLTINAPTGTPTDGQAWMLRLDTTNVQTYSWNAIFLGGTTALPTASTGSNDIDYYTFIYYSTDTKWHFTGQATAFAS